TPRPGEHGSQTLYGVHLKVVQQPFRATVLQRKQRPLGGLNELPHHARLQSLGRDAETFGQYSANLVRRPIAAAIEQGLLVVVAVSLRRVNFGKPPCDLLGQCPFLNCHPASPPRSRFDPPHHLPQKGTSSGSQSSPSVPPL